VNYCNFNYFKFAKVSGEAATARSRGCKPTDCDEKKNLSREAVTANAIAVAAWGDVSVLLWAYAGSYVLPSLRDSGGGIHLLALRACMLNLLAHCCRSRRGDVAGNVVKEIIA
jgi:hypothetical protein